MSAQFEAETGQSANAEFGAYVLQPLGDDLLIGLSNNPGNYNGALITRTANGSDFTTEHVLDEQGVHDMQVIDGRVFVPGTDPVEQSDEWTLGNLYERGIGGAWTKRRTMPNVIHALGLWHDGTNLFVAAGAHTGDNATWIGRVLRSVDDGETWAAQIDVTDYRVYDVIGHAGRLYATGYTFFLGTKVYCSNDVGVTWSQVMDVLPVIKPRMLTFGTSLIIVGFAGIYQIDSSHVVTLRSTPFAPSQLWNVLATDGANLYVIDSNGYVWRSADLATWTRYTYVANALALCWWGGVGLLIADRGLSARVWVA